MEGCGGFGFGVSPDFSVFVFVVSGELYLRIIIVKTIIIIIIIII